MTVPTGCIHDEAGGVGDRVMDAETLDSKGPTSNVSPIVPDTEVDVVEPMLLEAVFDEWRPRTEAHRRGFFDA